VEFQREWLPRLFLCIINLLRKISVFLLFFLPPENYSMGNSSRNKLKARDNNMSKSHKCTHTSRGTLREKHIDALARTRGCLCLRYGCNFGNKEMGEIQVVINIKALSAASHTKRLSCEDLRRSCTSCIHPYGTCQFTITRV
jgi:hypothetical protein